MRLLITTASSATAARLADALAADHHVRLTDTVPVASQHEFALSALGPDASTNLLVRDCEAIVHVSDPTWADSALQKIDYATRCTYNLLHAAAEEGVARVVFLSTLDLMAQIEDRYIVTERWRTRPTTDPAVLSKHLGEAVCREFGRERKLSIAVLRFGRLAESRHGDDTSTLSYADAISSVKAALTAKIPPWSIYHVVSDPSGMRYPITTAQRVLGYAPQPSRIDEESRQ